MPISVRTEADCLKKYGTPRRLHKSRRRPRGQGLEQFRGDDHLWVSQAVANKRRPALWTVCGAVALAYCCSVTLNNATRVVNAGVDLHVRLIELGGQGPEAAGEKIPGSVVVGKVYQVERVVTISAIALEGLGPAGRLQVVVDSLRDRPR